MILTVIWILHFIPKDQKVLINKTTQAKKVDLLSWLIKQTLPTNLTNQDNKLEVCLLTWLARFAW